MMLFEGDYINVGLVDYIDKFLDAMKNWQKYDYSYRKRLYEETLRDNYKYIDKENKKGAKGKYLWGKTYDEVKENLERDHLKELDNFKKWDEERKRVEDLIQTKLRSLKRVTATVLNPDYTDNSLHRIELGLKVGSVGYPHIDMENNVLLIVENQEGVFYEEHLEESTVIRWFSDVHTATDLRTIDSRPLKIKEWYQKLSKKSFW